MLFNYVHLSHPVCLSHHSSALCPLLTVGTSGTTLLKAFFKLARTDGFMAIEFTLAVVVGLRHARLKLETLIYRVKKMRISYNSVINFAGEMETLIYQV
jgi:hypothetical protein